MDEYYGYEYEEPTASDVFDNCVVPSIQGIFSKIFNLLVCNIVFNIITQTIPIPPTLFHVISMSTGAVAMYLAVELENIYHFVIFLWVVYLFLFIFYQFQIRQYSLNIEYVVGIGCIIYLLLCEFFYMNQGMWMQARGVFMVGSMKIISLSFDLQNKQAIPTVFEYFGYLCSPANNLFGPWIPFSEYVAIQSNPLKKNRKWLLRIFMTIGISIFFLTISNCWAEFFIPDDYYKWLVAYRQAHSFRSSHYFISYMSEAMMIAAGYTDDKNKGDNWGYRITSPLDIELPSSLVSVVVSWNIPMHRFLKKYIYRASLQFGHFKAIFATYLVSSLLHGFNVEIAAVLLTIGLYSYIQLKFQDKIALEMNSCLLVRACRSCSHKYKRDNFFVKLAHVLFSFLTIFNLIYLGVLMDSLGEPETPNVYLKWQNLDFLSHWVMLAVHIYTVV